MIIEERIYKKKFSELKTNHLLLKRVSLKKKKTITTYIVKFNTSEKK